VSRARVLFAAGVLQLACAHSHARHNAPGNIDVHQPPADLASRTPEVPDDPGEQMVVISAGALGGGGLGFGGDRDARGVYGVGLEASIGYGTRPRSHSDDDFFILPVESVGANIGWTGLSNEGDGVGPVYGELYYGDLPAWLAAGWAYDIDDNKHGPQITFSMLFLYARMTHLFDLGTQVQAGLMMKLPYAFVWSR
jgi:hypothetical protein